MLKSLNLFALLQGHKDKYKFDIVGWLYHSSFREYFSHMWQISFPEQISPYPIPVDEDNTCLIKGDSPI